MSHTPGPWRVARNWRDKLAIVGPTNDRVSTASDRICNLPHRKNGEGEANADLIAAAPELLEALEAVLTVEIPIVTMQEDWHRIKPIVEKARAVIAKAKGSDK